MVNRDRIGLVLINTTWIGSTPDFFSFSSINKSSTSLIKEWPSVYNEYKYNETNPGLQTGYVGVIQCLVCQVKFTYCPCGKTRPVILDWSSWTGHLGRLYRVIIDDWVFISNGYQDLSQSSDSKCPGWHAM